MGKIPADKIDLLWQSLREVFDPRKFPEEISGKQIVPFFIEEGMSVGRSDTNPSKGIILNHEEQQSESRLIPSRKEEPVFSAVNINELKNGPIVLMTNGTPLIYYLPFHFFYNPKNENREYGIYLVESNVKIFLKELIQDQIEFEKALKLFSSYLIYFAQYFNSLECFITRIELFERKALYKNGFSRFFSENQKTINELAHFKAANNLLQHPIKYMKTEIEDETRNKFVRILEEAINKTNAFTVYEHEGEKGNYLLAEMKEWELQEKIYHFYFPFEEPKENLWEALESLLKPNIQINSRFKIHIVS